jgi:hypothetical protein
MRTFFFAASLLLAATAAAAFADSVAFVGPAGWSHSPPPAATDPQRSVDQWHLSGDISTLTFIRDTATTYADALAAVEKNVTTNRIKTTADRDMPCRGTTGHVVEFSYGPDGNKIIMNRIMVPDGPGLDTVTYARSDGSIFDPDVKKAETTFCTGGPATSP